MQRDNSMKFTATMAFASLCLGMAGIAQAAQVHYTLDLTWDLGSPNGFPREMAFINGQFPGPPLLMDEGDDVTIDVNNNLPFNTTIHFHGIEQKGTPWSDGVPGLTQWGIQPGQSFTYKWHASDYGTYWYHAHDKATLQDGLYGAIYIRPCPTRENPFAMISNDTADLEAMKKAERNTVPLVLSDWDHLISWEYMEAMEATGYDIFCTDSILIDGKGSVYCKDPEELTSLQAPQVQAVVNATLTDKGCVPFVDQLQGAWEHHPEKLPAGMNSGCNPSDGLGAEYLVDASQQWASFSFISAASLKAFVVSIDEHPMYVYEVDGRYIEPQFAQSIEMYNGERYSVMVKLDREPASYTLRVASTGANQVISGFAKITYQGGEDNSRESTPYINYGGANITDMVPLNTSILPPYPPVYPASKADDFHLLMLGRINSSWQWTLDGTKFFPADMDTMQPVMFDPESPELASALKITTKNGTWVDLVYEVRIEEPTVVQPPHPMHKHSNKAFLIGRGSGRFKWASVDVGIEQNPENFFLDRPLYRDTFNTSPQGEAWMAVRYQVVNPGPFFLHCHMATHLHGGMGMLLLDGIDAWPEIPEEYL